MKRIAIATDSNSGITQAQGREMGIYVLPMPFYIDGELFFEDVTLSQEEFYRRLAANADVSTTQPAPGDVMALWDKALEDHDQVVYIPMSSGLSGSCDTALMLAQDYDGRVQVVNDRRISATQRLAVEDAMALAAAGKDANQIKAILEADQFNSDIYIALDTLTYLKKGGRLTPAAAAIGTVLGLKPVLRIKGEKLDAFAKVRGWKAAKAKMLETISAVAARDFPGCGMEDFHICSVYSGDRESALEWQEEVKAAFPDNDISLEPLSLSVACHIGPGARAITITKKLHI